jgi:succinate dehydrogenase/fumarate reductase flavoprotein subunit
MSAHTYDIVVIGGGMSGLMASLYLAGKGFKTALISQGDPVCGSSLLAIASTRGA